MTLLVKAKGSTALRRDLYCGKRPNRVWHLDDYDKFKPFGFEIQGCIDGYCTCVLWQNILRSNKHPKEECNVFVNYLAVAKGVARKVALGRENVFIIRSQRHSEGITKMIWLDIRSFYSGSIDWWVHFFKGLVHNSSITTAHKFYK